jgi:hypothetical protein
MSDAQARGCAVFVCIVIMSIGVWCLAGFGWALVFGGACIALKVLVS